MYQYRQIIARMRQGDTDREIRRLNLCGRRKAAELREAAMSRGWLTPESPLPEDAELAAVFEKNPSPRKSNLSSVATHGEEIRAWHREGLSGVVIHEALRRRHGYTGHYSAVRRYLQNLETENPERTTWLEFEPGDAAQVDFGKGPRIVDAMTGESIDAWFFVMTLAWSRHQYVELVRDQSTDTWLRCHRNAFRFFNGVPKRVIIDNPKCAITRASFHDPEVSRSYGEFASSYGFKIAPCPPRDPKKKGRVEAGVKYVKRNFLPLRTFRSLQDANDQVTEWILSTAGKRIHGTTKTPPLAAFEKTESCLLTPIPEKTPEIASWAKAKLHGNCHLQYQKSYYSAPYRYVSRELWIRATVSTLQVYSGHEMIAVHPRKNRPGDRSTVRDHLPPEHVAYLMRDPSWCRKKAVEIGPECARLIEALFSDKVLEKLNAAQGIIGLAKPYGVERVEAACRRALLFNDPKYKTVKRILSRGLDQAPDPSAQLEMPLLSPVYTGQGRFCRDGRTLLVNPAVPKEGIQ